MPGKFSKILNSKSLLSEADELLPAPEGWRSKLRGIQDKAGKSRATLSQLRAQMKERPDVLAKIDDLWAKMNQRDSLLARLQYSLELQDKLRSKGAEISDVVSAIPAEGTPWGKPAFFIQGVVLSDGRRIYFSRPIRTDK